MTRVLVVATSSIARAGLEAFVKASPSLELAGSSRGLATLAQQIEEHQPDVVLLDVDLVDDEAMSSLSALVGRGADLRPLPFALMVEDANSASAIGALRAGVRALLPRDGSIAEITAGLEAAAAGLVVLPSDVLETLMPAVASALRVRDPLPNQVLTPREIEVLRMLGEGLGNKMVADRLGISEHTVKFHISSIFTKLDASTRTEAVTLGIRQGIITV